jgi:hypothetical protein
MTRGNKVKRFVLCQILLTCTVLFTFSETISSRFFIIDIDNWSLVDAKVSEYTPETLLNEADYYYENEYKDINNKLPCENEDKIPITFTKNQDVGSQSWVSNRRVYIQAESVTKSRPVLAHEISHVVFSSGSINSYNEGLADYFYCKYTYGNRLHGYYKVSVYNRLRSFWVYVYDQEVIDNTWNGHLVNDGNYLQAECMVTYLIDQYGMNNFIDYLHGDGYKPYKDCFGKSKDELEKEWIDFVMSQKADENCIWLFSKMIDDGIFVAKNGRK